MNDTIEIQLMPSSIHDDDTLVYEKKREVQDFIHDEDDSFATFAYNTRTRCFTMLGAVPKRERGILLEGKLIQVLCGASLSLERSFACGIPLKASFTLDHIMGSVKLQNLRLDDARSCILRGDSVTNLEIKRGLNRLHDLSSVFNTG